ETKGTPLEPRRGRTPAPPFPTCPLTLHWVSLKKGYNRMITFPTILLRLGLALVLGTVVGFERESREHAAGMRTNALVSLGSCLFTIISAFGFMDLLGIAHVQLDPTRIASYVVAGIGFLGAGSIFLQPQTNRV